MLAIPLYRHIHSPSDAKSILRKPDRFTPIEAIEQSVPKLVSVDPLNPE